jgi:hypothetical protein
MNTTERRLEAETYAGFRSATIARSTGTLIAIIDGKAGGYDIAGGRWQTLCDDHGGICSHDTIGLARSWASAPEEWCPYCQDNRTEQDATQ